MTSGPESGENVYIFPTSYAQQRLWFLDQLEPGSASYLIPWSIRIAGALDVDALARSLNEIVRRHEVLRTSFVVVDGEPRQRVAGSLHIELPLVDLSADPLCESRALELSREEARRSLDLQAGPLVRAQLLRLAPDQHQLLLTVHHIIFDGGSRGVLVRELTTLYEAYSRTRPVSMPELSLQFADYAVWQRERLQGTELQELVGFWKGRLSGANPSLELPFDRPRPAIASSNGDVRPVHFPVELLNALRALARSRGATLFMTLLACFETLLSRYSGEKDFLVGTPIANRNRAELEGLIGFFANTLVLRAELSGDPSFLELLDRVKSDALGAYEHQDMPFEMLVQELQPERSLSHNPLFQVLFSLQNAPREAFTLPGLELRMQESASTVSKFDLSLYLIESPVGLRGKLEYNTDLFDRGTIERLLGHFGHLLEAVVADPQQRVSQLPLLSGAEREQILVRWNDTGSQSAAATVVQLVQSQVHSRPHHVAVRCGAQSLTYAELDQQSNQLARHLQSLGVGAEARVAVCMERTADMLTVLLGIWKAGAAYVPLDPAYPADRIGYVVQDAQAALLITQRDLQSKVAGSSPTLVLEDAWPMLSGYAAQGLDGSGNASSLAYVLYTSGSTGKPKGVQIEQGNLVNFLLGMQREPGLSAEDQLLAVTTLSFDIAGLELYLPLISGATVVLATREQAIDGRALIQLLQDSQATVLQATPATWRMLLESGWSGTPGLKVLCGGEAMPADLANRLLPCCAQLWNMYGPTETTIWSSVYRVTQPQVSTAPIGRPIANTTLYVLDAQLQPVPIGVSGELYIGGTGVARGYFNRADLTAERFLADPYRAGERIYRTGDVARYLPDGNVQFVGRADFQVKVRGYRIELGEIEAVLAQHASVQQCVVIVREDQPGDVRLVAYLVPAAADGIDTAALRAHLRQFLPDYMVPAAFVTLDALPLTPNGKIDRKALPADSGSTGGVEAVPPRDDTEYVIHSIWRQVLRLDHINVNDDFFELGGHSLLAVRMLNSVREATGREIPLRALFQGATIQHLADQVRSGSGGVEHLTLTAIQPLGTRAPLFVVVIPGVNTLGYLTLSRLLGADQPFYMLQGPGDRLLYRPHTDAEIRQMASEYVRILRIQQPQGPYILGGMCEGARVALEMVRQLEEQSQQVRLLVMFDTWSVENAQIRALWFLNHYLRRANGIWKSVLRKVGLRSDAVKKAPPRDDDSKAVTKGSYDHQAWEAYYWPGSSFIPEKIKADITVLKVPYQLFYYRRDPLMGWARHTSGRVLIKRVRARHLQLLREPGVRHVGVVLDACLREAQSGMAGK